MPDIYNALLPVEFGRAPKPQTIKVARATYKV